MINQESKGKSRAKQGDYQQLHQDEEAFHQTFEH